MISSKMSIEHEKFQILILIKILELEKKSLVSFILSTIFYDNISLIPAICTFFSMEKWKLMLKIISVRLLMLNTKDFAESVAIS